MKKKQFRHPTKADVLTALKTKSKPGNFESYTLIIEHKKISQKIGLVVVELLSGEDLVAIGKATVYPRGVSDLDSFNWENLRVDESEFTSFALDAKKQPISQMLIGAVKKSISEGRLPFLGFK